MALEALVARYGLLALFLGAGVEGEAVVVTGGVLAHQGLVPLWGAAVCAALGSFVVDQIWFHAGRHFREHRWVCRITRQPAYRRAIEILERYPTSFILAFRFIYGMRTVSPIAIGTSAIPTRRFVPLNFIAAAVWGPAFTLIGYWLGTAAKHFLGRLSHYGLIALSIAATMLLLVIGLRAAAKRR